ncbi:MAG: 5'/3'-nucleotidase SurE [Thermoanaerobacteraceae bacterium]|nr:5'/3'-nucleotidase SurE [Thermoanaerobacteraceae bacterium]
MILLTNDDGIYSPGIHTLAQTLSQKYEVVVVAPDRERSAISHAITMHKPLRVNKLHNEEPYKSYYVNGTPADCVKLSIEVLLKNKPDFIISGINRGANLGTDIIYSGTVSAAIESYLYGIPALAVSIEEYDNLKYDFTSSFISEFLSQIIFENDKHINFLLNINIPGDGDAKYIKGVRITKLGLVKYENSFDERTDPRGKKYYWLLGKKLDMTNIEGTDVNSIENDYISVTPLHVDLTDYGAVNNLESLLDKTDINKFFSK